MIKSSNDKNGFWAHTFTKPDGETSPKEEWEPLFTPFGGDPHTECQGMECEKCRSLEPMHGHLNKVAYWTARFAGNIFPQGKDHESAQQWGYIAGLWHDLGKFSEEFQNYLSMAGGDSHRGETLGRVDHSTAGAQHAVKTLGVIGHWLSYGIAGHHSGLPDGESNHSCLRKRLESKAIPNIPDADLQVTRQKDPPLISFIRRELKESPNSGFSVSCFTRMLFSCLVDADFLATEAFMQRRQAKQRNQVPDDILQRIEEQVENRLLQFGNPAEEDRVNLMRHKVAEDCRLKSQDKPGPFTLTVPTGGGKTISSLLFAIKHARCHGMRRIIYVVPFTSIIEQNAEVIRKIIAPLESSNCKILIEHHSALSPEKETTQSRLASENWDAPIVITTAVQFYESLFAAKTSKNRKIHNIANAVVILDEAQTLPVNLLEPCLKVLQELCNHYHTSIVLCTATQPAINKHVQDFPIGLKGCREIVRDKMTLFHSLKRVNVMFLGCMSDMQIVEELLYHPKVLCIVNRRAHAQNLYQRLGKSDEHYHLSALMCPEHRSQVLRTICERLRENKPTKVISTQLIEAGVDIDFPVVYRALAGLDSVAQAAGRCNRHGRLPENGRTYVFKPEDQEKEQFVRDTAQVAQQVIDLHEDVLSEDAIRNYFDLYYYRQKSRWDERHVMECFRVDPRQQVFPLKFQYKEAAGRFSLIDSWQQAVFIPYDKQAEGLIRYLRNSTLPLHRNLLRGLQRYSVQIQPKLFSTNRAAFQSLRDDSFYALISPELNYSNHFGLTLDEEHAGGQSLII
jgi:CRISPR-associated endonuclease/helicase Cas3